MKKPFLSLAAVALLSVLCACTPKPSDTDLVNGMTQAVQIKAIRMNPFSSAADTKIASWRITNQYTRDNLLIYEFEVKAHLVAKLMGSSSATDQTFTVAVAFQKNGNRWDSSPLD